MKPHSLAIGLSALTLSSCGGSGESISSGGTNAVPPLPPPPPPPPTQVALIDGVTADTQFAVAGVVSSDYWASSTLTDETKLQIRYLAATNTYQLKLNAGDWASMTPDCAPVDNCTGFRFSESFFFAGSIEATGGDYRYSNLLTIWAGNDDYYAGFGIATDPANIPTSGTAHFDGAIQGSSSAYWVDAWGNNPGWISGTIGFDLDFASGAVDGQINPVVTYEWNDFALDSMTMTGQLAGAGSNTFAGFFVTNLTGTAEWTGLLTGPNAEEAIGSFTFPYILPVDGNQYQASGAWIAKR